MKDVIDHFRRERDQIINAIEKGDNKYLMERLALVEGQLTTLDGWRDDKIDPRTVDIKGKRTLADILINYYRWEKDENGESITVGSIPFWVKEYTLSEKIHVRSKKEARLIEIDENAELFYAYYHGCNGWDVVLYYPKGVE